MAYTLISFVGTGIYKEDGYVKINYVFPDNEKIESSIFIKALLEKKYRNVSKIILLGTITSGWDLFLEDDIDLWSEIKEKRENKTLNYDDFQKIQAYIEKELGIPVVIKYHTDKIDSDTSLEIFNIYNSIIPEISDENILFDITHSFRSMPILLYQALQFSISQNPNIKNVELVYGELKGENNPAYVRDLSNYWRYSQISDALFVFKEKLDGFKLAELIESYWSDGAKCIKRISEIVQTNFSLQIVEVIRNIKNVLKRNTDNIHQWQKEIIKVLSEFLSILDENSEGKTLFNFAQFLYSKKLNIQAIIALQISVEVSIAQKFGNDENIGDYDWWQEIGKQKLKCIKNTDSDLREKLNRLETIRNQVAHGGSKGKHTKGFPQAANIPNIFESSKIGVEKFFKILKEER